MAKTRRKYKGNATSTTISGGLTQGSTSAVIGSATGWPTSGPFYMVVDPGLSSEEKVLVGSISGTTISSLTRGVDDTSDQAHSAGCTVYPVFTAVDADEANELTSTYAHQGAVVYQGASTFAELQIGTAAQVLKVNSGATAPEWGQVATGGIADSAVTLAKLASAVQALLVPVGTISAYAGASAPTGWLLCDGTSTTGYTSLAALVGSTTPDLRGKFLMGKTASSTGSTLLGSGGSTTIAEANLPTHTHTFSATSGAMSANATLSHSITDSGHTHTINGEEENVIGGGDLLAAVLESALSTTAYTEATASSTTGISVAAHDVSHTHSVSGTTGNGSGSGTAYYQPFVAVSYIIKHD